MQTIKIPDACLITIDSDNKKQGLAQWWHRNGNLSTICFFVDNLHHGEYIAYNECGRVVGHIMFNHGRRILLSVTESDLLINCDHEEYLMLKIKYGVPLIAGLKYESTKS